MTGPEHYREGERLLAEASRVNEYSHDRIMQDATLAIAHFAAAQAAVTALSTLASLPYGNTAAVREATAWVSQLQPQGHPTKTWSEKA